MTSVFEIIKRRRSVRAYKEKLVPKQLVLRLIEAARWAPTGANLQPWKFIIVTDEDLRKKVGNFCKYYFVKSHHVAEAPVLIVVCGDTQKISQYHKIPWYIHDCSMAGQNMMLAAEEFGLGTCWIGAYDEAEVKEVLDIPEWFSVVGIMTVGYAAEKPKTSARLEVEEIISYQGFGSVKKLGAVSQARRSGPISVSPKIVGIVFRPLTRIGEKARLFLKDKRAG